MEGLDTDDLNPVLWQLRDSRPKNMFYCPKWVALDNLDPGANPGGPGFSGFLGSWYPTSYAVNGNLMVHYNPDRDPRFKPTDRLSQIDIVKPVNRRSTGRFTRCV